MNPYAILATFLWIASQQTGVNVCSPAVDPVSNSCKALDSRLFEATEIDETAGQLAFIDPETRSIIQPTNAQIRELLLRIGADQPQKKVEEPQTETMPDGTIRVRLGSRFFVYERAGAAAPQEKP